MDEYQTYDESKLPAFDINTADKNAAALASAIKRKESQGNYEARGASGEFGAYQYTQNTWDNLSQKHLGGRYYPSPTLQDYVAYQEIKSLKDSGKNPAEIASIWNSGRSDYQNMAPGTNQYGVNYDVQGYVNDVSNLFNEEAQKLMQLSQKAPEPQKDGTPAVVKGLGKSVLQTVKGLGKIGGGLASLIGLPNVYSDKYIESNPNEFGSKLFSEENLKAQGKGEKVGKVVGDVAQLVLPATKISAAGEATSGLIKGKGLLGKAGRLFARAGAEGAGNAALGYVQSGGDKKQAGIQGAFGTASGLLGGVTKGLPENLYSKIFRPSKFEIENRLFGKEAGKSFAREAMDRGLSGNLDTMAEQVVKGIEDNEAKLVEWATKSKVQVPIDDKMYKTFDAVYNDLADVGRGEQAEKLLKLIANVKDGKTDMLTALKLRRLLDGIRSNPSFNKTITQLRGSQADLKYWSDDLRKVINKSGGQEFMKDWQFYISAKDALTKAALKSENSNVIDFFDSAIGAGSILGANPIAGAAAIGSRKLINLAGSNTYGASLAKGFNKGRGLLTPAVGAGISNTFFRR